jgi:2-polyprenyl-3-methyl-5-hydroxy-6-metoxy-1,4-benzoquinol methylase
LSDPKLSAMTGDGSLRLRSRLSGVGGPGPVVVQRRDARMREDRPRHRKRQQKDDRGRYGVALRQSLHLRNKVIGAFSEKSQQPALECSRMSVDVDRSPIGLWDAYWSKTQNLASASPLIPIIASVLGDRIATAKVLEVGAGSGRDIVALAKIGAAAYANDRSEIARHLVIERAASEGVAVELNADDLRALGYADATFDVVFSQGVLEHFTDIDAPLREQIRVTKRGGYIIVDVPQTFNPYTIYKQLMMF